MDERQEMDDIYCELPIFNPDWMPDDWEAQRDRAVKRIFEEWRNTIIFDAGSGKKITVGQFEEFYGTDEFSKELVDAANKNNLYSKETAGKIKALYSKLSQPKESPAPTSPASKPDSKPHAQRKQKRGIQGQFIPMPYGFVDKVKVSNCQHNPTVLLMVLLKHRTWPGKFDKHHTFTHWYQEKNLIVASRSIEQLSQEVGVSDKTIRRWLNELEKNGDIEKVKGTGNGYKRENVYVLGEVNEDGTEILYYNRNDQN